MTVHASHYDYIVAGRSLVALLKKIERYDDHRKKISDSIETASTGSELIFNLRFYCARLITLEEDLPADILSAARTLFKELDILIEGI